MADKFLNHVTPVCADWLNQVDRTVYTALGGANTVDEAKTVLGIPPPEVVLVGPQRVAVPASNTAPGTVGQWAYDDLTGYYYWVASTNVWVGMVTERVWTVEAPPTFVPPDPDDPPPQLERVAVPASNTATGTVGQWAYDELTGYYYWVVSENVWFGIATERVFP